MELYRCFACGKVVDDKAKGEVARLYEVPGTSGSLVFICKDCLDKAKQGTLTCESLRISTMR